MRNAHLDKYDSQLPQVIEEIEQHEIFTISVSMDPEGYAKSKAIDEQTEWVLSTFGVHPWNAPTFHSQLGSSPTFDRRFPNGGGDWT
jgi:TatD DNase family protein